MDTILDNASKTVLSRLYQSGDGLPFDALNITDMHYFYLLDAGFIEEPKSMVFSAWGTGRRVTHSGNIVLTVPGRACWEQISEDVAQHYQRQRDAQTGEAIRLSERAEDKADAERRYRGQNRVTFLAAIASTVLGFALGVIAEHYAGILSLLGLSVE